jgi:hypothetical protein
MRTQLNALTIELKRCLAKAVLSTLVRRQHALGTTRRSDAAHACELTFVNLSFRKDECLHTRHCTYSSDVPSKSRSISPEIHTA